MFLHAMLVEQFMQNLPRGICILEMDTRMKMMQLQKKTLVSVDETLGAHSSYTALDAHAKI